MNDNELLIEKFKTQKILDDIAEHDLAQYVSNTHARIVPPEGGQEMPGTRVALAFSRRRREVQHRVGQSGQAREAGAVVEIGAEGGHPGLTRGRGTPWRAAPARASWAAPRRAPLRLFRISRSV